MHNTRLHIIRIFTLLMLLVIGAGNGVWAEVRYHILTLPFSIRNYNNTGFYKQDIRVEALLVVSDAPTIGLPDQYKSPLATGYKYYTGWETPEYTYLFHREKNTHVLEVKYNIYRKDGGTGEIDEGTAAGTYTDIYVTYDYTPVNEIYLDKTQDYNITVGGNKFMCYNRSRNNRIGNANAVALTGEELVSTEFVDPTERAGKNELGFSWSTDQYAGKHGVHMGFWLAPTPYQYAPNPDPYNITIMTSYVGDETYQKDPVESKYFVKPYKGATLFCIIKSNANGQGTDTKLWFDCDNDLHYKGVPGSAGIDDPSHANYWEKQVDYWPGYFRHTNQPLFNSVALLNHPSGKGYVFVGSKFNQGVGNNAYKEWAPNSSGYYATLTNDNNNPMMKFMSLSSSPVINIYKIRNYTIKVKTHGTSPQTFTADMRWSDAMISENIVNHIPEVLKRKYCSYKAYADEGLTTEITTFNDAKTRLTPDANGKIVIWLDYTVTASMPFETLPADGSYENAHWYTMRVNGKAEAKNIAHHSSDKLVTGSTSIGDNTNLHRGENSAEAMVAFVGDPYRLKILNRAACEAAPAGNRYVGCATSATDGTTLTTNYSDTGDIITWEIMYESTDMDNFVLRQFGTYSNPKYIGWDTTGEKPVVYSTDSTRIRVLDLDKVNYTYHIMRADHSIAIKATVSEYIGKSLKDWKAIPTIIRSPFLSTASVTYYASQAAAEAGTPTIANAPYDSNRDIYVRYSFETPPAPEEGLDYNVSLNNEYIYTSTSNADDNIYSKFPINADEAEDNPFAWTLYYRDPYSMKIWNKEKNKYVKIASSTDKDKTALEWDDVGSLFIVKQSGDNARIYEVMLATGEDVDAGDAPTVTTTYYNIGRDKSGNAENTVKLFSNASYFTGYSVLQFQLTSTTATEVTYHLIDKAGIVLLQAKTRQKSDEEASFPPQYRSPLVAEYHYYTVNSFDIAVGEDDLPNTADDVYTLKTSGTTPLSHATQSHIYVTYDVNDLVNLRAGQLYLLEYEAGETFHQEDGSDGVNPIAQKAVYPYINGDGNFFVYGKEQYELQQQGAASTRTRWAWFVQSTVVGDSKGDPYHVTIRSRQSESYPITNSREYNAYFMTYKPDGYSEVVTTLAWPGMSSETATEYMVLGNEGQYQLVTTNEINGSRYVVNSFEQYWKTFDTIKKKLLDAGGETTGDDPQITVPETAKTYTYNDAEKEGTYRTYLEDIYGFHHYVKWAYAKRWNGYNNGYSSVEGKHETKKGWETIEHWYQTVKMGQGYFNFVKTSIDPVLILLDQHGWEVMRKPLPSSPDDPEKEAKYDAIRPYNSPMVKEYAFWATAKKRTGFHQYYLLSDRVGGENFTSTDLTNLPPYGSDNVLDKKGNQNDQYVTYIVKDEYAQSYNPDGKAGVPFLIEQGKDKKFAISSETELSTRVISDIQNHILNENVDESEKWYVMPNPNIDIEMGYGDTGVDTNWGDKTPNGYSDPKYRSLRTSVYVKETDEYKDGNPEKRKTLTDTFGQFSFSNGFDPYNIQIQSVADVSKYMKTNAEGALLAEGSMSGTYPATPGAVVSLGDNTTTISPSPKWFDSRNLAVTNATFMAVQDAEGNMQLMPRFDHNHRMSEFGTLIYPDDADADKTHTKLYRAEWYDYRIIDNDGHESLRYKSGGDLLPQTPDHFKSPLAKDYAYYATATKIGDKYINITDSISGALDGASLTGRIVYVRYKYDEDADGLNMLKGNWLTMQLNNMTTQYTTVGETSGIYPSSTDSYSLTAADDTDMENQAKKLTATGDYYFRIGTGESYSYKKVTVTRINPETPADYSTDETNSSNWDVLPADSPKKLTAVNDDDMADQAKKLTTTDDYYFRIGAGTSDDPYKYVKVTVTTAYIESSAEYSITNESGSSNWDVSKPLTVNADGKKWQWKFIETPQSERDPYAVYIFNRSQGAGVKAIEGRFAVLSHSEGEYALAKAGSGGYTYEFLNGSSMSTSVAASIAEDKDGENASGFTNTSGTFHGTDSQVKLTDEVQHAFTYKVYTNSGAFAIEANQTQIVVENNNWEPVLPEAARTPLLNIENYRYYETLAGATAENATEDLALTYLFGLYDDIIYTHYTPYIDTESNYMVPNAKTITDGHVARGSSSNDAPIGLDGKRIYNFIWYNDDMMKSNTEGTGITSESGKDLQNVSEFEWTLDGNDPYAIKIKSIGATNKYIHENATNTTNLDANATTFMLLNREGYQYGVLAKTGSKNVMLSGYGNTLVTDSDPTKFIIFALSTYKVIYHLVIANIGSSVSIPYAELENGVRVEKDPKVISGSTLRDLVSQEITEGTHVAGDKYQLGVSLKSIADKATGLFSRNIIYCHDAGNISLGDVLKVPSVFSRPNVNYDFYIEGIYNQDGTNDITAMNNKYKGLKMDHMGDDKELLGKIVFVNIVYSFMGGLDTNSGSDFVKSVGDNKWYTYETSDATPRLAEYTGVLKTQSGHATHYTDDYLWTPVGDPYGFKMYNRYAYKNSITQVMTTTNSTFESESYTVGLYEDSDDGGANAVYELLATTTTTPGYFIVHPVVNNTGLQYYMNINSSTGDITVRRNTTPTEWTFGLSEEAMRPYYEAAGYVGGLNAAGKAAYKEAANNDNPLGKLMAIQDVVYNHDKAESAEDNYIVHYAPGYYRLHSQPGSSGITTPRYASGYTHKTELTAGEDGAGIPLHFYEVEDYGIKNPVFTDLGTADVGYTETIATRGDIPLSMVTDDPASIFYFSGAASGTPSSTMQTQGLYVKQNVMTETENQATTFNIIDIGAGVVALSDGANFLKYDQTSKKYDLKFNNDAETVETARWCMQPVQKSDTAGDGEMPLRVNTNNGSDDYYYTTFYAPFDVMLLNGNDIAYVYTETWDADDNKVWKEKTLIPKKIGDINTGVYANNNRFIPAGTPVIIRTSNPVGYVTMALPNSTPATSALSSSCVFSGEYLEQMLTHGSDDVFVFGRPLGTFTKDGSYASNGLLTISSAPSSEGVGFYVNANPNKEASDNKASWTRNNKYVLANKIYYRATPPNLVAGAREFTRGIDYIPVVFDFDFDEEQGDEEQEVQTMTGDNRIYDMQGRCVATEEQVRDGSWRQSLSKGMYILNGKKFMKKN